MHLWTQIHRIYKNSQNYCNSHNADTYDCIQETQRHAQMQHTHTTNSLLPKVSKNLLLPNTTAEVQENHLHIGDGREWKRENSDVLLLATVWWPHQSATRHSSSPCLVSIIPTHMHRERVAVLLICIPCCRCCSSLHIQPGACTGTTQLFTSLIYTSQI